MKIWTLKRADDQEILSGALFRRVSPESRAFATPLTRSNSNARAHMTSTLGVASPPRCAVASTTAASRRMRKKCHQWSRRRGVTNNCLNEDERMFVPAGAFSGTSPERRASEMMNAMLTYVSTWIVIAQLENVAPRRSVASDEDAGPEGEGEAKRVVDQHAFLLDYLEANPCRDGDAWIAGLVRENPTLAERIMAVRTAYAEVDFEWHNVRRLTLDGIRAGNERAMREWFAAAVGVGSENGSESV